MTERLGSSAGWRTAAVVAPAAAAALALATGWAVQHPPVPAVSAGPAPAAAPVAAEAPFGADHGDLALHQRALAEQARVVRLTTLLRKVQARTRAVRSAPVGGGSGRAGYVGTSGGGSVSVAAPPAPVARAAAPATHTSTGASGAR